MPDIRFVALILILALSVIGCNDEEKKLRTWQQQQVDQLQRQSQENSAAARSLVEADAESRRQFVVLEQSVQAERKELSGQYSTLESDRKAVAAARERVPLLATAFQGLAALALGAAALWVCGRMLGRLSTDDDTGELEETLILSLAGESDLLAGQPVLLKPPEETAMLAAATAEAEAPAIVAEPPCYPRPQENV